MNMRGKVFFLLVWLILIWGKPHAQTTSTWSPFAYQGPYLESGALSPLDSPARVRQYYELLNTTIKPTALDACNAAYIANFQFYFGVTPAPVKVRVDQTVNGLECWMKRVDDPRPDPLGWTGAFGDYADYTKFGGICLDPAFVKMQIDLQAQGGDAYYNWKRQWRSSLPSNATQGPWFDDRTGLCYCQPGSTLHSSKQFCIGEPEQLLFSGVTETRPAGTGGTSTITFTAKTTAPNGQPKAGVALSFSADVKPNSGGHEHAHDATREKGTVIPTQGVTNAAGELVVKFSAPKAAGIHTIKATCPSCDNKEVSKEIQVKVPGLIELGTDTATPPQYALVGAISGKHTSNHWFMPKARDTLLYVVSVMNEAGWGKVGVNDGSLIWGGLFDVKDPWKTPHSEHRVGTEVDIAFNQPKSITEIQKKKTYSELCKKDNAALGVQTLWHEDDLFPDHFHIYLTGQGLTSKAKGGPCCISYVKWEPELNKDKTPVIGKDGKPVLKAVSYCEETTPR